LSSNDDLENGEANSSDWSSQMEHMLFGKPGLGTRCMDATVHTIKYVTVH